MNNSKIQKERLEYAKMRIEGLGYDIFFENDYEIRFNFEENPVYLFPYSGWFQGFTINKGRGLNNLLKQIKQTKVCRYGN